MSNLIRFPALPIECHNFAGGRWVEAKGTPFGTIVPFGGEKIDVNIKTSRRDQRGSKAFKKPPLSEKSPHLMDEAMPLPGPG